jgi:hypothetical protein
MRDKLEIDDNLSNRKQDDLRSNNGSNFMGSIHSQNFSGMQPDANGNFNPNQMIHMFSMF